MKRSHEKIGAFLTLYAIGIAAGIPWASEMASSAGYPDDLHRIAETVLAGAIGFVILGGGIAALFARNSPNRFLWMILHVIIAAVAAYFGNK